MERNIQFTLLFWLFALAVFFLTDSNHIITYGPKGVHAWRQADCTSYALNYYQNALPFLKPQVHNLAGKNGYTVSEFPILYFIAAKLYGSFGKHDFFLRGLNFLIFVAGCTFLLWLCLEVIETKWIALIPTLLTFTSPYLYYYALNFLPDVPALSLSLIAWYFVCRFFVAHRLRWLYIATIFFCLACLIKISAGVSFAALVAAVTFSSQLRSEKYFKHNHLFHFYFLAVIVTLINIAWILFVKKYNDTYGNHLNLIGVLPIWDISLRKIGTVLARISFKWIRVILQPLVWVWLIASIYVVRKEIFSVNLLLAKITQWILVGTLFYSVLWFQAYEHHDYYMVNPFIAVVGVLILVCKAFDGPVVKCRNWFSIITLLIIPFAIFQVKAEMFSRYNDTKYTYFNPAFTTIEPYLRHIGIPRRDNVLSIPDVSPNITLYYLNQPGVSTCYSDSLNLYGIKYVVVSNQNNLLDTSLAKKLGSLKGEYQGIKIFSVKE